MNKKRISKFQRKLLEKRFSTMGVCMALNKEIWRIKGRRLQVGKVVKVTPGVSVTVDFGKHGTEVLKPEHELLMAKK